MSDLSQMATSGDERHGGDVAALDKLFANDERWGCEERKEAGALSGAIVTAATDEYRARRLRIGSRSHAPCDTQVWSLWPPDLLFLRHGHPA